MCFKYFKSTFLYIQNVPLFLLTKKRGRHLIIGHITQPFFVLFNAAVRLTDSVNSDNNRLD